MNPEPKESERDESWGPCAPGTLQAYAHRAKATQRRQVMARVAGAAVVLVCVALGVWTAKRWSGQPESSFGGIACSEVRANLDAYTMGTLPEPIAQQMNAHLRECPACQDLMREMQQMHMSATAVPAARCSCPRCRTEDENASVIAVRFAHFTLPRSGRVGRGSGQEGLGRSQRKRVSVQQNNYHNTKDKDESA